MSLIDLKGVGPKTELLLNKLNIFDINDLITYYPYKYEVLKRSNILNVKDDEKISIDGVIETIPIIYRFRKNMDKMQFNVNTKNNIIKVIIYNRGFMKNNITIGKEVVLIGKYDKKSNTLIASDIMLNMNLNIPKIIPFYSTTEHLTKKAIHTLINNALNTNFKIYDYIPDYLSKQYLFIDKKNALNNIHNPNNIDILKKSLIRLKYEELFMFMIKINVLKMSNKDNSDKYNKNVDIDKIYSFISSLPFKLTSDQLKSLEEIINDLNSNYKMNRLLQGDVGSGKTIVAFLAIYGMINSNYQCALMAPTEILAVQHYEKFKNMFPNINVELLTGSVTKKKKEEIYTKLSNGEIDLIIGTHALIQDGVSFKNLGLIVTDEQHRFGVMQRNNLRSKGIHPDVLYLSATPIPRTYALTIYADMSISTIKTMPIGRKEVKTVLKDENEIKDVLTLIKKELDKHHQVYVVAPLIEDENNDSVTKLLRQYSLAFKKYNIDILHGKMKSREKDNIMKKFINHEIDILISTTVIEVGVDVKNATMIVIHNSDLFGLSTLHQLRGRVGRNEFDSYCILIGNKNNERNKIMEENSDGFIISEKDFLMRGSGDLFGVKQSGDMNLKIADIKKDFKILLRAKDDSMNFLKSGYLNNYNLIKEELYRSINISNV